MFNVFLKMCFMEETENFLKEKALKLMVCVCSLVKYMSTGAKTHRGDAGVPKVLKTSTTS